MLWGLLDVSPETGVEDCLPGFVNKYALGKVVWAEEGSDHLLDLKG